MAFEFADIFFGSHQKREGIPTPADGAVRIYKKVGKSFTTSGFFKKSSDIFFGATSQNQKKQMREHLLFRFGCNEAHLWCTKNEVAFGYEACLQHIEKLYVRFASYER